MFDHIQTLLKNKAPKSRFKVIVDWPLNCPLKFQLHEVTQKEGHKLLNLGLHLVSSFLKPSFINSIVKRRSEMSTKQSSWWLRPQERLREIILYMAHCRWGKVQLVIDNSVPHSEANVLYDSMFTHGVIFKYSCTNARSINYMWKAITPLK